MVRGAEEKIVGDRNGEVWGLEFSQCYQERLHGEADISTHLFKAF